MRKNKVEKEKIETGENRRKTFFSAARNTNVLDDSNQV